MRISPFSARSRLSGLGFLLVALSSLPVSAQTNGDTAAHVSASYAGRYARYYAPYAIQAAAAYIPVDNLNATRAPDQQPPLDGSDVRLAVASVSTDVTIASAATKYLQSWQYQFGSEGYLTCFENDPECLKAIAKDRYTLALAGGPTFHVWGRSRSTRKANVGCSEISIAFRGSTTSSADWITNLDPVTGYVADNHYRQLRRNIDAIIKKITRLDCYRRDKTQIVSVGHSLGAGLAQFAAVANNPARPRISKVFAFDPSPVTGVSYVDAASVAQNKGVEVDLVYQNGEALQRLRSIPQRIRRWVRGAETPRPCTREVVFDVFLPAGAVALHNMSGLAREMVGMASDQSGYWRYQSPKKFKDCPSRYVAPLTDEDDEAVLAATDNVPSPILIGDFRSANNSIGADLPVSKRRLRLTKAERVTMLRDAE